MSKKWLSTGPCARAKTNRCIMRSVSQSKILPGMGEGPGIPHKISGFTDSSEPHFAPPPTRPIAPKISWTLSPLDLCPCAEFGRERSYSWRLIFRTPEAGSENIMIFSKISKYRKYQKNIMIFFIFFIFSIFSRKWKFRIGHKCNNGCNTLMQYLMTVSYQSFVPFRRILRYTFALWLEPFVCDVVAPYTQRVKIFGNILHHLIA